MTDEAFETISRLWAAEMAALQGMDRPDLDDARLEACYEKVLVEHPGSKCLDDDGDDINYAGLLARRAIVHALP